MEIDSFSFPEKLVNIFKASQLQKLLQAEFYRARRYSFPLSCIMICFANFYSLRDLYGHKFGDQLMEDGVQILEKKTRLSDFICRYRGDRFFIILPHTDEKGALVCANKLLKAFQETSFSFSNITVKLTANLGVAENFGATSIFKDSLVGFCEKALESAVKQGPNSIWVWKKEQEKE